MDDFKQDLKNIDKKRLYQSIFVLFLLITIPVGFRLAGQTQVFAPKAQDTGNIQILTNQLLDAKTDYENPGIFERIGLMSADPEDKISRMVSTATIRKKALKKEAMDNPKAFLENATLASIKDSFPAPVQPFLEEERQLQGEVKVIHGDDFENSRSEYLYKIEEFNISFIDSPKHLIPGATVSVDGIELDQNLVVPKNPIIISPPSGISRAGSQRVAVMLVNFIDSASQAFPGSQWVSWFNDPGGVNDFFKETSGSKIGFTGEDVGTFTIPPANSGCDLAAWADAADIEAGNSEVNLTQYQNKVYIMGGNGDCSLSESYGELSGNRIWITKTNYSNPALHFTFVLSHELGHNLNLNHAHAFDCKTIQINFVPQANKPSAPGCSWFDYGDSSTVMGDSSNGAAIQFNAPHREALNWISESDIETITVSGDYSIEALENSRGTKIIKIPIPGIPNRFYYISYRQPIGFDVNLPQAFTEGISIHYIDSDELKDPTIIDTNPSCQSILEDAPLSDNRSFSDYQNGIIITQTRHASSSAQISVNFIQPQPQPSPSPCPSESKKRQFFLPD